MAAKRSTPGADAPQGSVRHQVRRDLPPGGKNGYVESFIGSLWDELLERDMFGTLGEAKLMVVRWRRHCNEVRRHS